MTHSCKPNNGILSIQSHVVYGYVGNKSAVYPLQCMGFDVWPIHTVQFSNHTEYGAWQGEIFTAAHIRNLVQGLYDLGVADQCRAIVSGYLGSIEIGEEVFSIVKEFKSLNPNLVYLCDPVFFNPRCCVKPEVQDFFKNHIFGDVITPNQFEAEQITGVTIKDAKDLKRAAHILHDKGVKIVFITGVELCGFSENESYIFGSDGKRHFIVPTKKYHLPLHGTGDLFAALFLGHYLKTESWPISFQHAVFHLDPIVQHTVDQGLDELQILSCNYRVADQSRLPQLTHI